MNKTFSILTPVLLEHNYINFFVEYHIKLGFDKIYVLIDNSNFVQDEYIIENEEYKNKVIFIDSRDIEKTKIITNPTYIFIHSILQKIYKNILVEDYTILLGIDSFLFLNNLTIQDYFIKYNITDDISQIFFRWINIYNKTSKPEYNLLKSINFKQKQYNANFYTLGNRKLCIQPHIDSHFFDTKNNTKGFYNNIIFDINYSGWDIIFKNLSDIHTSDNFICHFLIRDIYDVFIKSYYYWNENITNLITKKYIIDIIVNNLTIFNIHIDNFYNLRLNLLYDKQYNNIEIDMLTNIENTKYKYNHKYMKLLLTDCNITEDQLLLFIDKL